MSIADDAVFMCSHAPGAVDVTANGESSRGPIEIADREVEDASGERVLIRATAVMVPTAHLPSLARGHTLVAGGTTYRVREIQLQNDGLVKDVVLVA